MAFASYANKVQNGLTQPYKKFLEGADTVTVVVTLSGGEITVQEVATEEPAVPTVFAVEEEQVLPNPILDEQETQE